MIDGVSLKWGDLKIFSSQILTKLGIPNFADPLTETHGGTNQTSYAKGDILIGTASNTLGKKTIGADGTILVADTASTGGAGYFNVSPYVQTPPSNYLLPLLYNNTPAVASLAAGTIYFTPFTIYKTQIFTALGFSPVVGTAVSYKTGVYNALNGMPTGTLITNTNVTTGPLTTATATNNDATFGAAVTLSPGQYYAAILPDTTGTANFVPSAGLTNNGGSSTTATITQFRYSFSQSYATGLTDMTGQTFVKNSGSTYPLLGLKAQ